MQDLARAWLHSPEQGRPTHLILDYVYMVHWEVHMYSSQQVVPVYGPQAAAALIDSCHEAPLISICSPAAFLQRCSRALHQRLRGDGWHERQQGLQGSLGFCSGPSNTSIQIDHISAS